MVGGLTAAGLIVGCGWGAHGGWRLIVAAAAGLAVAIAVFELPAAPAHGEGGAESADLGDAGQLRGRTKV
jgi:hypothetical protein